MRDLAVAMCLTLTACAGTPARPLEGPRPAVLDDPHVIALDPDGNGSQVVAFLEAHHAGRTAGLCGIVPVGDENSQRNLCIVTHDGIAQLTSRIDERHYVIYSLQHRGNNRFEMLGTSHQQVVLEPWPLQ